MNDQIHRHLRVNYLPYLIYKTCITIKIKLNQILGNSNSTVNEPNINDGSFPAIGLNTILVLNTNPIFLLVNKLISLLQQIVILIFYPKICLCNSYFRKYIYRYDSNS